jgi:hypothetical protein
MTTMRLSPSGPSSFKFWRNLDQILASNSREIERPRETDVYCNFPHIERMTAYDQVPQNVHFAVCGPVSPDSDCYDVAAMTCAASSLALSLKLVQFSRYQSPMVKF